MQNVVYHARLDSISLLANGVSEVVDYIQLNEIFGSLGHVKAVFYFKNTSDRQTSKTFKKNIVAKPGLASDIHFTTVILSCEILVGLFFKSFLNEDI